MIDAMLAGAGGICAGFVADAVWRLRYWGRDGRHGLRVMEHYHHGLGALAVAPVVPFAEGAAALYGLGVALFVGESLQAKPFAYRSGHGRKSTAVGVAVAAAAVATGVLF